MRETAYTNIYLSLSISNHVPCPSHFKMFFSVIHENFQGVVKAYIYLNTCQLWDSELLFGLKSAEWIHIMSCKQTQQWKVKILACKIMCIGLFIKCTHMTFFSFSFFTFWTRVLSDNFLLYNVAKWFLKAICVTNN